jgi:uncharacterized membrane protein
VRLACEFLATVCAGLFAGAALYISAVEHPARMGCGTAVALAEFRPSYRRATVMQASLAVISFVAAVGAWWLASEWWLLGGALIIAVVPLTLVVIFPTNKKLLDTGLDPNSEVVRALLTRWGMLHCARTVLSVTAFFVFVVTMALAHRSPPRPSGDSILGAKESVLRQDLFEFRSVIIQYTIDKGKAPQSLDDLVMAGYLKQVPIDPMTGRSDWAVVMTVDSLGRGPFVSGIHSSSRGTASDGRRYTTW